mmetsp:Transcript_15855/g.34301  ORF Transcript_15855/g.34301 Transcript_15855/m.34301 type:complete len:836 (-) Transcript_15855:98-2605(-)
MEVINIDSSDDEDVPSVRSKSTLASSRNKECSIAASRYVTQETNQSDASDSSVSSADSIWDKIVLPSKPTKGGDASIKGDVPLDSDDELEIVGGPGNVVHKKRYDTKGGCRPEVDGVNDYCESENPAATVDAYLGNWKIMLLMDLREFGQHKSGSDFLKEVEKKINNHFGGIHCEKQTLPSADYMFVARLISNTNGEVIDERVLDLVIERKDVNDLQTCLTNPSKKYKPLKFFEAQMYKMQNCGISNKLFLMEGDEDNPNVFSSYNRQPAAVMGKKTGVAKRGVAPKMEQLKRLKRVKTVRIQIEKGEFQGVDLICTKNKHDTVKFLIQQLERFKKSFNPLRPPEMTTEDHKKRINEEMEMPTFREYLRLISLPGVGPVNAMKVIMDPKLDWDKSFICPSCTTRKAKSTLEDRATFWGESSAEAEKRNISNQRGHAMRTKDATGIYAAINKDDDPSCGICRKSIDIWTETGVVTCNRVAKCGKVFHESCLTAQSYDIGQDDGCILCRALSKFSVKSQEQASNKTGKKKSVALPGEQNSSTASSQASKYQKPNTTKSTTPVITSRNNNRPAASSSEKDSKTSNTGKRKRPNYEKTPSEKLYIKRPKLNQQPATINIRRTSIDRNGCLSNPLHDVDKSVAAALFLDEEVPGDVDSKLRSAKKKKEKNITNIKGKSDSLGDVRYNGNCKKRKSTCGAITDKNDGLGDARYNGNKNKRTSTNGTIADKNDESSCGICSKSIDIWVEEDIVLCNRVSACGATFHQSCLTAHGYDFCEHDGCIKCEAKSKFSTKSKEGTSKNGLQSGSIKKGGQAAAKHDADIIVLDSDSDDEADDVIVID